MDILVNQKMTIAEVQDKFNDHFPNLKLEFYTQAHEEGEGTPDEFKISGDKLISEVSQTTGKEAEVSLHGNLKTSTLEEMFENSFGLHVQVFRKSGNIWLQTTKTDEWTLSEQERTAEEMNG